MRTFLTKFIAISCIVISAAGATVPCAAASATGSVDKNWTFHSSFDNQPRKVIDTPDAVYFFVHPYPYQNDNYNNYLSNPTSVIFKLDKSHPEDGLLDLRNSIPFSQAYMRLLEIDHASGAMAVAYPDGGVDYITPDGKVTFIDNIRKRLYPGSWTINSLTFDPATGDLWVGTSSGYMYVPAANPASATAYDWGSPVTDITPLGSRVIAIVNSQVCEAAPGKDATRLDSFTAISGMTTGTPLRLMPLDANNVAYINSNGSVQLGTYADGKWTRTQLRGNDTAILKAANKSVANRVEQTVIPSAGGYYISSAANALFLERPANGAAAKLTTAKLPGDATLFSSSNDFSTVWYYRERGEFVSRTLNGTAWTQPTQTVRPNAPLTCRDVYFAYSPEHGFLTINADPSIRMTFNNGLRLPALLTSYRNGKWTNLSPAYHTPYAVDTDPLYQANYSSLKSRYPVWDPHGFYLDPNFPDVAHMGSNFSGAVTINIADPSKPAMMTVSKGHTMSKLGAKQVFRTPWWGDYTGLECGGVDANGVLWFLKNNYIDDSGSGSPGQSTYSLYYLTADQRRQAIESEDPSALPEMNEIVVNGENIGEFWFFGKALSHPKNRNKLLISTHGQLNGKRPVVIVDHKGTLDNPDDDTVTSFTQIRDQNGGLHGINYLNNFVENPETGEILICCEGGTFFINTDSDVSNYVINGTTLEIKSDNGGAYSFLSPLPSTIGCYDEFGRLWLATPGAGLIGVSRDMSRLVAYFSAENSPLPSNTVNGVGWNPETKTLFASTDSGIVEIRVDDIINNPDAASTPFVTPQVVKAGFSGTVAVNSLPAGAIVKVSDTTGKTVASLDAPKGGTTHWNLLDNEGNRVPAGRYVIVDATGDNRFTPVTVVVNR